MKRTGKIGLAIAGIAILGLLLYLFGPPLYWRFYWGSGSRIQSILPAPPGCYIPPGVMVDGSARATIQAWDDFNGDGIRSIGEPPLQDVIVIMTQYGFSYDAKEPPSTSWAHVTDKNGQASLNEFRPGCPCYCWRGSSVAAWGPSGYKATTPTMVALSADNQVVTFGFTKVSP